MIEVVGLGPATLSLITKETWEKIRERKKILLRTKIHPTVKEIEDAGIIAESYDNFYDEAANFEELYKKIATDLITRGKSEDILYGVPGSPFVAEKTVALLRERAKKEGVDLKIYPAVSFLDLLYQKASIDPIEGLAIVDAKDEEKFSAVRDFSLIITQVYSKKIASDVKLSLMEHLDDEYEIFYAYHLGLIEEKIQKIMLFELDRIKNFDYLTSLYVKKA